MSVCVCVCVSVCVCLILCDLETSERGGLGSNWSLEPRNTKKKKVLRRHNIQIKEREKSVVNQHNLFRKMSYSNNKTTCFGM